jgi:hypothetical protein
MGCISAFNRRNLSFVAGKLRKEVQCEIRPDAISEEAAVMGNAATEDIGTLFHWWILRPRCPAGVELGQAPVGQVSWRRLRQA